MKNRNSKFVAATFVLMILIGCEKSGKMEKMNQSAAQTSNYEMAADSVSIAASQKIPGKKFVKTADVNMEVKDVYDATVFIEKQLQQLGGFVTQSRLQSEVVSEKTFETSDTEAMLVKKFQTENKMQVRVPTEKLGDFLTFINDKKLFLNSRIIIAEDVTDNARIAKLQMEKLQKTGEVIGQMKNNGEKVEYTENNLEQKASQQIDNLKLEDNLKYSTVDIYIKEPKLRVAEIAVTNTKSIDNKYKSNFFYDFKNALVEGFYLVKQCVVMLAVLWPLWLVGGIIFYFASRRKKILPQRNDEKV